MKRHDINVPVQTVFTIRKASALGYLSYFAFTFKTAIAKNSDNENWVICYTLTAPSFL